MPDGRVNNGRPVGSPNKRSGMLRDRLKAMGCDPVEITARIAMNDVPCGVCRGKLKTKYRIPESDDLAERVCMSCYGTGMESVNPELRFKASAELLSYIEAKRKAIEHTGADGEEITIRTLVVEYK